jgi:hypothetical protein
MSPHGLAAEFQSRPNRQLSLCQVTLDCNMGGEARKKKTNGELKMENGKWKTEHQLPTFHTARPSLTRSPQRICDRASLPTSDFRLLASGLWPSVPSTKCPMPRVFVANPFRSRWDKTRNRSTAMSYGDRAKGTKRMCPNRVGLFPKDALRTLGFLSSKKASAPRGAHGFAERMERSE